LFDKISADLKNETALNYQELVFWTLSKIVFSLIRFLISLKINSLFFRFQKATTFSFAHLFFRILLKNHQVETEKLIEIEEFPRCCLIHEKFLSLLLHRNQVPLTLQVHQGLSHRAYPIHARLSTHGSWNFFFSKVLRKEGLVMNFFKSFGSVRWIFSRVLGSRNFLIIAQTDLKRPGGETI
jgi:hypothetical protein